MAGLTLPRQRRSQKTLDRLLDACEGLLREKGFEEISVSDIARRARSSVGAFYGRFRGKEALLDLLDAKSEERIVAWWESYFSPAKWEGVSTEEILRQFVSLSVRAHRESKGTLRALFLRLRGGPTEEMLGRALRMNRKVVEGFRDLLSSRRAEIDHPNPDLAILHGLVMVIAAIREWVVFEDFRLCPSPPTDEALAEELARAFAAYLGVRPRSRRRKRNRRTKR
jgi:AcrR family transcriptional regulator